MKVQKWLLSSFAVSIILTAAAVILLPNLRPIEYVIPLMKIGVSVTVGLAIISFYFEGDLDDDQKTYIMIGFLASILVPTLYTAGAFVHESQTSWSGGEVHYHADYEILVDQNGELERTNLIDPSEFCEGTEHESTYMCDINDRTGSTEYHEHNDQRIHLEGIFKTREEASLASFFETFRGELTNSRMVYPTNEGTLEVSNDGEKSLKILVEKGRQPNRYWCIVGQSEQVDTCESYGEKASSPDNYVVSAKNQNPADSVTLDNIFIIYDESTPGEAVSDLKQDGKYRGFGLKKAGEGYDG